MELSQELLSKYHMTSMDGYKEIFGNTLSTEDVYYRTFLCQTDHVPNKIVENLIIDAFTAISNGEEVLGAISSSLMASYEKYVEIIEGRIFCREKINEVANAMQAEIYGDTDTEEPIIESDDVANPESENAATDGVVEEKPEGDEAVS